jgi:hypothetical protein
LSSHSEMLKDNRVQEFKRRVTIDVEKFYENALPNEDIARVIKKVLQQYDLETLPSIVHTISYKNAVPSDLDYVSCFKILYSYASENKNARHPAYYVETVLETSDVTYTDKGISYDSSEGRKTVSSKMGMLADSPIAYYAGACSSILNYYTRETVDSVEKVFANESLSKVTKIPQVDLTSVRSGIKTYNSSVTISREMHYEAMLTDQNSALVLMDKLYANKGLVEYSMVSEAVKKAIVTYCAKKKMNYVANGRIPAVTYMDISISELIQLIQAWTIAAIIKSQIGGENSGMGGITSGYYSFDMTPSVVKSLARAREIIAILKILSLRVVKLPSTKEFKVLCQQILVANGISVISTYGSGVCVKDSPVGLYQNSEVTYLSVVSNTLIEPSYTKMGMKYDDKAAKIALDGMFKVSRKNKLAALTYLVKDVKELEDTGKFFLFPSLTPHSGKVWLIKEDIGLESKRFDKLVLRFASAAYHRALFPVTRRPYFTLDPWNNYFPASVRIPKIYRSSKKEVINLADMIKFTKVSQETPVQFEDSYEIIDKFEEALDPKILQKMAIAKILADDNLNNACHLITDVMFTGDDAYISYLKESIANSTNVLVQKALTMVISTMENKESNVVDKEDTDDEGSDTLSPETLDALGSLTIARNRVLVDK